MKSVQYFNFENSLAALDFYEKNLGATDIQRIGGDHEMFTDMPEEFQVDKNFTMNASFKILGETFYCSDTWKNKKIDNSGAIVTFTFDYHNEAEKQLAIDFFNKAIIKDRQGVFESEKGKSLERLYRKVSCVSILN